MNKGGVELQSIPYEIINNQGERNNNENVKISEKSNHLHITITKKFPSSGYSMDIAKVQKEKSKYVIYASIKKPDPKRMYLTVITYSTKTLKIDKKYVENKDYIFDVKYTY